MPRFVPVVLATALVSTSLLAGCGGSTPSVPSPGPTLVTIQPQPQPQPPLATATMYAPTSPASDASSGVVRGRVYDQNGRAMAGVIVEFKNLSGGNGHTSTRSDGSYAIQLPSDVYTALALTDQPDSGIGFDVVGGDNSISVPETTRVDFQAYDIG